MKEWIIKYWLEAVFGIIIGFITYLWKKADNTIKEKAKEKECELKELDVIKLALKGLLHKIIIEESNRLIEQQYCTSDEYEELYYNYYKPYKALNGNGTAERAMEEVNKLPSAPVKKN